MAVEPVENDCIDFVKMKFIDNTLYFKTESDENLESDYFGKLKPRLSIIRNLNNQVLFVYQGKQPMFEDMTDSECRDNASQTEIIIYIYKDSNPRSMAVTLSVKCKTIFTLSCRNKNISFQEMSPPDSISGEENEMIFFMRSLPGYSSRMEFESSLYKEHFLACKKENDLFKLILKKKDEQGDQSVIFTVDYKD